MSTYRTVKLVGVEELVGKLKENVTLDDVKKVVKHNGEELTEQMKRQTTKAYIKGYSTGDLAGSIKMIPLKGGMAVEVKAFMDYAPYVEYGTRYMTAEPIVQPSLDVIGPKFINDLKRLTK